MEIKKCELFGKCSGCQLMNLSYEKQLSFKQKTAIRLLGGFCHVDEIIGMENPLYYRNKVQIAFGKKHGKAVSGIYQSKTKNIVEAQGCMIENKKAGEIAQTLAKLFKSFKLKPYDRENKTGFVRHVLVRSGFVSGQIMVVIVTAEGEFPSERSFVNALTSRFPEITTIVHNVSVDELELTLGEKSRTLYGNGFIEERLCGLDFRISPRSFYQVNPVQTEILYAKAKEFALLGEEGKIGRLIDAYCGTGTIGLTMADSCESVIGVELNGDAVCDAEKNAELNGVKNAQFFCADAGEFMTELSRKKEKADVVITDPPRAGCSREFLQSLIKLSPRKIVYVSCNPETLARDLRFLSKRGYRPIKIQPVDMFPFTRHLETVVLLSKLKSTHHIELELKTDEFDLTSAESKATYDEIKAYVKEHTGLTVSSLNNFVGRLMSIN